MRDYTRCGRQIQCIPLKCNACGREVMIPGLPAGRPLHLGPHPDKAILMAGMGSSQNASPSGRGGEQCVAIFAITPFPSVPPVPPKLRGYRNPCRLSRPACARKSRNIVTDEKIATDPVSTSDSRKSPGAQGSKSKGVTAGTAMASACNLH